MRRRIGLVLGLTILAGCGEATPTDPLAPAGTEETPGPASADISDANNGGNPHFYWLPPVVLRPRYSGVAVTDISPVVEICLLDRGTMECAPGTPPLATLGMENDRLFDRVFLGFGGNFWVTWRRSVFTPAEGESYRVSVKVEGVELGFFDVEILTNGRWWNLSRRDGFIFVSDAGPFLFGFRIEEGALEQAFCDAQGQGLEDCDVQQVDDQTGGVLRLFENPGAQGETPAAVINLPPNSALLDGQPISEYVVVAELEDDGAAQGGAVPGNSQIPYLVDFRTEPPGITFDLQGSGVQITLCQDLGFLAGIPESLHPQLRPFVVYPDGSTDLPSSGEYSVGAPECEGYGLASSQDHDHGSGVLARLGSGLSRVGSLLLPQPLLARRLHGGLNTTVYSTRNPPADDFDGGDGEGPANVAGPGGANAPTFELQGDGFVVELGAVLEADPLTSVAIIPNGEVGVTTVIHIQALNGLGEPYPFGGDVVEVSVAGANPGTLPVTDNGDGTYSASYVPVEDGQDVVTVTLAGSPVGGGSYVSQVVGYGDIAVEVTLDGNPMAGVEVDLYSSSAQVATAVSGQDGKATFSGLSYGDYVAQASGGYDFDVEIAQPSQAVDLNGPQTSVSFAATTTTLPANTRVWRIAQGGNGNAYEYVRGGGGWDDALVLAQEAALRSVPGHLATLTSAGENAFVNALRFVGIPEGVGAQGVFGPSDDMRAWIGLTDQAQEGSFAWITREPFSFTNWSGGEPNNGGGEGGNEDFVEVFASGEWNDIVSPTGLNQGYVVEWEVHATYPVPPISG